MRYLQVPATDLLRQYGLGLPATRMATSPLVGASELSQLITPVGVIAASTHLPTHSHKGGPTPLEHLHVPPGVAAPLAHFCRDFAIQPVDSATGQPTNFGPRFMFLSEVS